MSRLINILNKNKMIKLKEADEEAPAENTDELTLDDTSADTKDPGAGEAPVEGTEEVQDDTTEDEETSTNDEKDNMDDVPTEEKDDMNTPTEDIDKAIEEMIGMTEIQHTSSSTIIDFEDGGQVMFVHPMVSLKSETLNEIIKLIMKDITKTYASNKDEITGKDLNKTRYWKSLSTLIETMVRSQLTKSDNMNGLIDEIKQVFKVLEVK